MTTPRPSLAPTLAPAHLARVRDLLRDGRRKLLGLVGAPGAGKSTLALALQQAFPGVAQVVPMDGFHLANVELQRLGRAGRKGAPDTFDSAGYVALLARLRTRRRRASSTRPSSGARSRNPWPARSPCCRRRGW